MTRGGCASGKWAGEPSLRGAFRPRCESGKEPVRLRSTVQLENLREAAPQTTRGALLAMALTPLTPRGLKAAYGAEEEEIALHALRVPGSSN